MPDSKKDACLQEGQKCHYCQNRAMYVQLTNGGSHPTYLTSGDMETIK